MSTAEYPPARSSGRRQPWRARSAYQPLDALEATPCGRRAEYPRGRQRRLRRAVSPRGEQPELRAVYKQPQDRNCALLEEESHAGAQPVDREVETHKRRSSWPAGHAQPGGKVVGGHGRLASSQPVEVAVEDELKAALLLD